MIFVFILSMLIFKRNYRTLQFISLTILVIGLLVFSSSDVKEADSEEEAMLKAQDSEPLCAWDSIEQDSYFEYVECATKEVA